MTVVLYEMLVVLFAREVDVDIPFIRALAIRQTSDKSLKHQYFRTIPEAETACQPRRTSFLAPALR